MTANPVTNHSRPRKPKRLSVEITLGVVVPPERASRLLLGEAFKAAQAEGIHLDPPPSVLLRRVEGDTSRYEIQFFADPEKIGPKEACSAMLTALLSAVNREGLPNPVQQVELSHEARSVGDHPPVRDIIGRVSLFADALSAEQLDLLASRALPSQFPPGAELMLQGAQDSAMFVILEGAARVTVSTGGAAAARQIAILAGGDVVGEMSLMTGAPRSATVTAITPLRALCITKETIEALFESAPELLERFGEILAKRDAELKTAASESVSWDFVQRDLLARMRTFFSRAFSGNNARPN